MAPARNGRPSFSPPRPGKSRSSTTKKKANARGSIAKQTKSDTNKHTKPTPKKSRYTSATESESDSQGGDDTADDNDNDNNNEHEHQHEHENEDEDEDEEMQDETATISSNDEPVNELDGQSPEPDYILAEVTREDATPVLPLPLIHRILHSHFGKPDKTKLSKDAREVVGKYIEVFVREAIMRCAYEKNHEKGDGFGDGDGDGNGNGNGNGDAGLVDGWLEVDDLEKVAVQLCLDF